MLNDIRNLNNKLSKCINHMQRNSKYFIILPQNQNKNMDKITICSWNANGIRDRVAGLIEFLCKLNIGIILINKTKLNKNDRLKIKGYNCIRKERQNRAGGVAVLVRKDISYQEINLKSEIAIENICIRLENNIHIIAAYNRPLNRTSLKCIVWRG